MVVRSQYADFRILNQILILKIKGFPKNKLSEEIDRIVSLVGLDKDLNKQSKNLSGGMKRRLMVAMSFVGDSKIIILGRTSIEICLFKRLIR